MLYSLLEHTDSFIVQSRFYGPKARYYHPTEASVVLIDPFGNKKIMGKCLRQAYYRATGHQRLPENPRSKTITEMGNYVEKMMIEWWKQMGVLVSEKVKFNNETTRISGELDCVLKNPETNQQYVGEVKSVYGYQAFAEIWGNRKHVAGPKKEHLLQTLVYLKEFEGILDYAVIYYVRRDNGARKEHIVRIFPDEEGSNGHIVYRAEVNGEPILDYTINDIYDRFALLHDHVLRGVAPEKEFLYKFDTPLIEKMFQDGDMSKSKYEKWTKGKEWPGDWQCSYCSWLPICQDVDPSQIVEEEEQDA